MNFVPYEDEYIGAFAGAVGLICGTQRWTNRELNLSACSLAQRFLELGLRPGDRVALVLPNCMELIVASSAVWMAGGVTVVLDEGPESQLAPLLADCEPVLVLTREDAEKERRQVVVSSFRNSSSVTWEELSARGSATLDRPVTRDANDIAQLCYTSGATGRPKAVIYTHGGTAAYLRSFRSRLEDGAYQPVVLLTLPPTAFGARLIAGRLAGNVRYVLAESFVPSDVYALIERHRITEMPLVPTMAEQLLMQRPPPSSELSSLKQINIGGSHVSGMLVRRLRSLLGRKVPRSERLSDSCDCTTGGDGPAVSVVYGMTEAGGGITSSLNGGDGKVGRPLPGLELSIVDKSGRKVPPGEKGEIVVRSPYAGVGYWKDAEASGPVFRAGFVWTGDIGTLDADNELTIFGRTKELIIQGGQNIYPGEISSVLLLLDGIVDCAVIGLTDEFLGEVAVACVVPRVPALVTERVVREHCRQSLNRRRCPVHVVIMEDIPRNSLGKVRQRTLMQRASQLLDASSSKRLVSRLHAADVATRADILEKVIARSLGEILPEQPNQFPVDSWEMESTFGDLGLTSIDIVTLAKAIERHTEIKIVPTYLFAHPTVTKLAAYIAAMNLDAESATIAL